MRGLIIPATQQNEPTFHLYSFSGGSEMMRDGDLNDLWYTMEGGQK